ncbi:MAG: helix-turn-helix domain-containing protein [Clostridia bacterium]|nr:helix-turn-helix domain-containing protein [Clostridia bacterium]
MKEQYISRLYSVVLRNYAKNELEQYLQVDRRKEAVLICVLRGESLYEFGEQKLHLYPGDVLLIPRGSSYRRLALEENYQTVFVYLDFEETAASFLVRGAEGMEAVFLHLYKVWAAQQVGCRSECLGLVYSLYARLLRHTHAESLPDPHRGMFEGAVRRMLEENATVAMLAAEAGVSEVHFRRCFKRIYQCAPRDYVNDLRLSRAKELLQYDGGTVAEIAEAVGFADPGYFARLFKQKVGCTPTEYKKMSGSATHFLF